MTTYVFKSTLPSDEGFELILRDLSPDISDRYSSPDYEVVHAVSNGRREYRVGQRVYMSVSAYLDPGHHPWYWAELREE